ncbi:MAG: hypothetical protein EBY30_19575 [Rhodospirillales bacterium]|jgi:hypothetical protein|nr:hypothetical protein [Rhodospirillales bacterium]
MAIEICLLRLPRKCHVRGFAPDTPTRADPVGMCNVRGFAPDTPTRADPALDRVLLALHCIRLDNLVIFS